MFSKHSHIEETSLHLHQNTLHEAHGNPPKAAVERQGNNIQLLLKGNQMKGLIITLAFFALESCRNGNTTEITETEKQKDSLTAEISDCSKNGVFNGFAVSIVNDKGTLYQQGFGFADIKNEKAYTDSTIQNIASISKTFVGLALLKAEELGT